MRHDLSKLFSGGKDKPAFEAVLRNTACGKPVRMVTREPAALDFFYSRNQPKAIDKPAVG